MRLLIVFLAASFWSISAYAASISPNEATNHVGETATVCGTVASAHYANRSRGQPTFLNLGHAYPNPDFTAVIWGEDRQQFGTPEALEGHNICVTGSIALYRGTPEVILRNPSQLKE